MNKFSTALIISVIVGLVISCAQLIFKLGVFLLTILFCTYWGVAICMLAAFVISYVYLEGNSDD